MLNRHQHNLVLNHPYLIPQDIVLWEKDHKNVCSRDFFVLKARMRIISSASSQTCWTFSYLWYWWLIFVLTFQPGREKVHCWTDGGWKYPWIFHEVFPSINLTHPFYSSSIFHPQYVTEQTFSLYTLMVVLRKGDLVHFQEDKLWLS